MIEHKIIIASGIR